jgi:hypothetical protein
MAMLDEELVEHWLNNKGFFCMRGVKSGLGEIDFLCVRPGASSFEAWHVEVQVCREEPSCLAEGSSLRAMARAV